MATIPYSNLRHVRKTFAFDGSANNGNLGDQVPAFTATGSVFIEKTVGRVTETLVCSAGAFTAVALSHVGNVINLGQCDGDAAATTVILPGGSGSLNRLVLFDPPGDIQRWYCDENLVLVVEDDGGGADITDGTLIWDVWYYPITDDGALAGDDIDATLLAAVNAEVVDVLATDTYAEPSAVPAATASLKDKIGYLFAKSRNKRTQTATTETIFRDDGSTDLGTSTKSDDGTTFTKGEDT